MRKDTVFRGCTRPAMLLGVPILPLFVGAGSCLLLAAWFNLFWLLALPPVVFSLQLMVRHDDMVFRLLGIRWLFRLRVRQRALHGGMWVFSPLEPRQPE
ncbi:VirB3 family type IV secretion system protein [Brachymonas sp. G13]|uniref:type IV secretion system protein VirB3 n=1 Tax=Brachymonas TaxID=28219 RepID=UPI001695E00F|nr:VirB3 family type IV secretion system protein [Brachymonas sp. J145]MEE1653438.1 VirB3 family type IV secretion system protein [Brachymonas sp. J145]NLX16698.1 hypothetical protein [Ramlibacter sp.]